MKALSTNRRLQCGGFLALLLVITSIQHAQGQTAYPNAFSFPGGTWGSAQWITLVVQGPGGANVLLGVTSEGNGAYYSSSGVSATLLHTFTQTTSNPETNPLLIDYQNNPTVFGTVQNNSLPKMYSMTPGGTIIPPVFPFGSQKR